MTTGATKAKAKVKGNNLLLIQTTLPNIGSQIFPNSLFIGKMKKIKDRVEISESLLLSDLMYFKEAEDGRYEIVTEAELQNQEIQKKVKLIPRLFVPEPCLAVSSNLKDALSKVLTLLDRDVVYTLPVSIGSTYERAYQGVINALNDPENPFPEQVAGGIGVDVSQHTEALYNPEKQKTFYNFIPSLGGTQEVK